VVCSESRLLVTRYLAEAINKYGGNAEGSFWGEDAGLKGSLHLPFADMDNAKVGALLEDISGRNGLDNYA
jgi:hypothetical protein